MAEKIRIVWKISGHKESTVVDGSGISGSHQIMRILALGLGREKEIRSMRNRIMRTRSRNVARTVHLEILSVISVVVVCFERETSTANPALEASLVKQRSVLQRTHFIIEICGPFASEAWLLHYLNCI
ncbi:hypothetical protein PENTCL1PPCAC_7146, partial [Pristionchus entomophagus]